MKKFLYTEQAVIRTWRNIKTLGKVPTSHFGHAAVTVVGKSVPTTDVKAPNMQNISFWPESGASFRNAHKNVPGSFGETAKLDKLSEMNLLTCVRLEVAFRQKAHIPYPAEWDRMMREANKSPLPTPRAGQKQAWELNDEGNLERIYGTSWLEDGTEVDIPMYYQSPESNIYLPGLLARGEKWGLNLGRMAQWWISFQQSNPQYCALSVRKNCVGVALQGLHEGGASTIVKPPVIRTYGEPVQLESYAQQLATRFLQLNGMIRLLDAGIRSDHLALTPAPLNQLVDGIWTSNAWKKASALGIMYQRSALICEIDRQLSKFERLSWKENFVEKYDTFMDLFLGVFRHRQEKSDSKRAEAVAQLGTQILNVLYCHGFSRGYVPDRSARA